MIIPPELRTINAVLPASKTRAMLEDNILTFINRNVLGVVPLRYVSRRFSGDSRKFNIGISDLLNDMAAAGRLSVKYFDIINRSFVFTAETWRELHEDPEMDWHLYETRTLRDLK